MSLPSIVAKPPDFDRRLNTTLNVQETFTLNTGYKISYEYIFENGGVSQIFKK